jgi:hypothetical protein
MILFYFVTHWTLEFTSHVHGNMDYFRCIVSILFAVLLGSTSGAGKRYLKETIKRFSIYYSNCKSC